ncbi:ribonuclease T2 [Coleophoma crateriformis]|uniref:Ribonuclease T2-like n=1 Tax=Coleophoma crateriformis TaxID=565419 RepID=A0A3D8T7T1_9HELO|nr:ribonuclease T2 [Coleophoma crateriformis]
MSSFLAQAFVSALVLSPITQALGVAKTCSNPQLSCQNTTVVSDLCCFNAPGGQLLQTQFWDTNPVTGPSDSWTIHGLWPDHCDGTYDSNCDSARAYTNITSILESFGKIDLLSYMNTYWKDYQGNDESFWEHEWAKHGTCISTFDTNCYTGYTPTQEIPDFFQKTVDLFKTLPSYTWLSDAGIVPSSTATYTSAAILAALKAGFGYDVIISCSSSALDEIWYSYNVKGSIQTGTFVPTNPDGSKSSCPSTGIKYLPKTGATATATATSTGTATKTTTTATSTSTGSFSGKGYLNAVTSGSTTGCLISAGTWYTSGTCATYTATTSGNKGNCGISGSSFTCAFGVTATVFTASGGYLAYDGSTTFYAPAVPSGSTQEQVSTSSGSVEVQFAWQSI